LKILLAGATGVIGRPLVSKLLARGDRVTAISRTDAGASSLRAQGVDAHVCDVYDERTLLNIATAAQPDTVVHQLTALPRRIRPNKPEDVAPTNRLRTEGTKRLLSAAAAAGSTRFVAQSIAFITKPEGPPVLEESAPLHLDAPASMRPVIAAAAELERLVAASGLTGVVLRYGFLYGSGTSFAPDGSGSEDVMKRRIPIVGGGEGVWSFVHVDDAAEATVRAIDRGAGVYNVADDDPSPAREWIARFAELKRAPRPLRVPAWLARPFAGAYGLYLMTELRGASNAKAKRELDWSPARPSWREGLHEL
jgi:nucleoside-diphosphate-sugar epimerase